MRTKKKTLLVALVFLFGYLFIHAQISFPGKPFDISHDFQFIEVNRPSAIQNTQLYQKSKLNNKSDHFADNVDVFYSPENSGMWDSSFNRIGVWRVGFFSPGASSIGIIFNQFHLQPGTKLFIYSPSKTELYGAFTFRNNNKNNLLAIAPVRGDSVIIELQVVPGNQSFGILEIKQIGLGFSLSEGNKSTNDRWYGTSADCHIDVNCIFDQQVHIQKYSVCKIIYNNTSRCTGTLINNTRNDSRPLVLTAAHCISNESQASTAIYFFDYESPYCNGPDGPIRSISGSRLLATNKMLDFSLVELNENVPYDYYPVFSGWDITNELFSKTYTIHHPQGDVKKISINNDRVIDGSEIGEVNGASWVVADYEVGTTEKGSSGSALFDSAFHVRGTLSFGGDTCTPYIYDYYSKFDRSWNYYSDSSMQLAHWLDPANLSVMYFNSYIPVDPLLEYSEQLSNVNPDDSLMIRELINGWGFPSGLNSNGTNEYAERFHCNGSKYIYALKIGVAKASTLSNVSKIIFKIWDGTETPENIIYQKELLLFELLSNDTNLIRLDTSVYVNQNFFVGYEIQHDYPTDSIVLFYTVPRLKQSGNTAFVRNNNQWELLTDGLNNINTSLAIFPLVFNHYIDSESVPGEFPFGEITLYPNPAIDHIQILLKDKPVGEMIYKIYDLYGKEIVSKKNINIEPNFSIDISNLPQGMYILKVYSSDKVYKNKFVKLK